VQGLVLPAGIRLGSKDVRGRVTGNQGFHSQNIGFDAEAVDPKCTQYSD
jgi:hypothetical protein